MRREFWYPLAARTPEGHEAHGGVLDNRIALTIPLGSGGTAGLRLVEVIDTYSCSEFSMAAILRAVAISPLTCPMPPGHEQHIDWEVPTLSGEL